MLNLEDAQPGPMLVALARGSNGEMTVYYAYTCHPELNGQCDGSCGNSQKEPNTCRLRSYPYVSAVVNVLVPSGSHVCPDWRVYAQQDPRTSQATRANLQGMTQVECEDL